jgi:hypothetical protein
MQQTVLQDAQARKDQYLDAIRFYLNKTKIPVLFVENSGNDISAFFREEISSGRLEVITFHGNKFDRSLGKGYGEMLIIEHATSSELFKKADFVFKITGRYKVLNINTFIQYYSQNESIDIMVNFRKDLSFADSRFFGAKRPFYSDFLVRYKDQVNDSKSDFFEHALSKAALESIILGYKYSGLGYYPRFSGIRGTDNSRINDSLFYWIVKVIAYRIFISIQNIFQIR